MAEKKSKELLIEVDPANPSLYVVRYKGGGEVPKHLQGRYTKRAIAQQSIELYLNHMKRGSKKNGDVTAS